MSRTPIKPFLINKDEDGRVRLTVRTTRYNMQNYPIVTPTLIEECFKSTVAARNYAKAEFGAEAGQFAAK
jgi:hypothetical protein